MPGLYVHIPFCRRKCFYCDFVSISYNDEISDKYLNALEKESLKYKNEFIDTLYIGGGTPSVLSVYQLEHLISIIKDNFNISRLQEFTIELNPESVTKDKLNFLFKSGITRISIGLQSIFNDKLTVLGRLHNYDDFKKVYYCSKEVGFDNINVDLIYGIPGQTLNDWGKTLTEILKLNLQHISLYPLTVEPNTDFYKNNIEPDTNLQYEMYNDACKILKENGFEHYEISNWAKDKKYSKHNILYWQNKEYIGLGVSASSYYKRYRYKNNTDIFKYIENVLNNKDILTEKEYIDDNLYNKETIMLGLRLSDGVDIKFFEGKKDVLDKYVKDKMLIVKNDKVRFSEQALFVSNSILADFI